MPHRNTPAPPAHDAEIKRLNRVSGQIDGIRKMIEDHRHCPDILSQLRAARAALRAVEVEILRRHLGSCVTDAIQNGDAKGRDRAFDEVVRLIAKFDE